MPTTGGVQGAQGDNLAQNGNDVAFLESEWLQEELKKSRLSDTVRDRLERIVHEQYGGAHKIPVTEQAILQELISKSEQLATAPYNIDASLLEELLRNALLANLDKDNGSITADAQFRLNDLINKIAPFVPMSGAPVTAPDDPDEANSIGFSQNEINYLARLALLDIEGESLVNQASFDEAAKVIGEEGFDFLGDLTRQSNLTSKSILSNQDTVLSVNLAEYYLQQETTRRGFHYPITGNLTKTRPGFDRQITRELETLADFSSFKDNPDQLRARLKEVKDLVVKLSGAAYQNLNPQLLAQYLQTAGSPLRANNNAQDLIRTDGDFAQLSESERKIIQRYIVNQLMQIEGVDQRLTASVADSKYAKNSLDIYKELIKPEETFNNLHASYENILSQQQEIKKYTEILNLGAVDESRKKQIEDEVTALVTAEYKDEIDSAQTAVNRSASLLPEHNDPTPEQEESHNLLLEALREVKAERDQAISTRVSEAIKAAEDDFQNAQKEINDAESSITKSQNTINNIISSDSKVDAQLAQNYINARSLMELFKTYDFSGKDVRGSTQLSAASQGVILGTTIPTRIVNGKTVQEPASIAEIASVQLNHLLQNSRLSAGVRKEIEALVKLELEHDPVGTLQQVEGLIERAQTEQETAITIKTKAPGSDTEYRYNFNYDNFLINHLKASGSLNEAINGDGVDKPTLNVFYTDLQAAFEAVEKIRASNQATVGDSTGQGFRFSTDLDLLLAFAVQDAFYSGQTDATVLEGELRKVYGEDPILEQPVLKLDFRNSLEAENPDTSDREAVRKATQQRQERVFNLNHGQVIALLAQYSPNNEQVNDWDTLQSQLAGEVNDLWNEAVEKREESIPDNAQDSRSALARSRVEFQGDSEQNIRSLGEQITYDLLEYFANNGVLANFESNFSERLGEFDADNLPNDYYTVSAQLAYEQQIRLATFSFGPKDDLYSIASNESSLDVFVDRALTAAKNRASALGETINEDELRRVINNEINTWVHQRGGDPLGFIATFKVNIRNVQDPAEFANSARDLVRDRAKTALYVTENSALSTQFHRHIPAIYLFRGKYLQNLRNYQTVQLSFQRDRLEDINSALEDMRNALQDVRAQASDKPDDAKDTVISDETRTFMINNNIRFPGDVRPTVQNAQGNWEINASVNEINISVTQLDSLSRSANDEANQIGQTLQQTISQYSTNFEGLADYTRQYFQAMGQFLNG